MCVDAEEQVCADLRQLEKQHVWKDGWIVVYARACTILSGKHHRHRIMSRYGTAKTTINRFFSYPVVARVSRCVAVVLLLEEVGRPRWVAGLAELSTCLPCSAHYIFLLLGFIENCTCIAAYLLARSLFDP